MSESLEPKNMRPRGVLRRLGGYLAIFTLLTAFVLLLREQGARPSEAATPSKAATRDKKTPAASQLPNQARVVLTTSAPSNTPHLCIITVFDFGRKPVVGARLFRAHRFAPHVRDDAAQGETDSNGQLEVDLRSLESIAAPHQHFIWKVGFQPTALSLRAGKLLVYLDTGVTQKFACESQTGQPVANVRIAIAPTNVSAKWRHNALSEHATVPTPFPERAIYTTVSDNAGLASISGLPRGHYYATARHATHWCIAWHQPARRRDKRGFQFPGAPLRITLGKAYAAVIEPPADDEIVFRVAMVRNRLRGVHPNIAWSKLRQRFPSSWLTLGIPADPNRSLRMRASVLLARSGWTTVKTNLVPIGRDMQAIVLKAQSPPKPCHSVQLATPEPLDVPRGFPAPRFTIEGTDDSGRSLFYVANAQQAFRFPAGKYTIKPLFKHVVTEATPKPMEVAGPTSISVPVHLGLVPCKLVFASTIPGVQLPSLSDVYLEDDNQKRLSFWSRWDADDAKVIRHLSPHQWLKPGRYLLSASASGIGTERAWFDVSASSKSVQVLRLEFDGQSK